MFYNIPYEKLAHVRFEDIKTYSFVEREAKLLQYVQDRSLVDADKAEMEFTIYEKDVVERHIRIPRLRNLYERKLEDLRAFQKGKDPWKKREYR